MLGRQGSRPSWREVTALAGPFGCQWRWVPEITGLCWPRQQPKGGRHGPVQGENDRRNALQGERRPAIAQPLQATPGNRRPRHRGRERRDGPEVPESQALAVSPM
jgi:hypothetical protein